MQTARTITVCKSTEPPILLCRAWQRRHRKRMNESSEIYHALQDQPRPVVTFRTKSTVSCVRRRSSRARAPACLSRGIRLHGPRRRPASLRTP
eukprot:5467763-Pyramimonas_sp.AAC.2